MTDMIFSFVRLELTARVELALFPNFDTAKTRRGRSRPALARARQGLAGRRKKSAAALRG
jgi:hypothetical protein